MQTGVSTQDQGREKVGLLLVRRWQQLTRPSLFTIRQAVVFLLLAFALMSLRAPRLVVEGRIWAEEGVTYLQYAWNVPVLKALVAPHQGYYSLWDNGLALVAARLLPLQYAALLFSWAALLVQLLTAYLVVSCSLADSVGSRFVALLALVLTSATKEVWINMENCQFWFPVCVALLLIGGSLRVQPMRLVLLSLAGLTGVTSCMLTPLYWARAAFVRTRSALVEASVLTVATLVQVVAIFTSFHAGARETLKPLYAYLGPVLLQRVWVLSLFTTSGANAFAHGLVQHPERLTLAVLWVLFLLITTGTLIFLYRVNWRIGTLLSAGMLAATLNWNGCFQCDYHLWAQSSIYDSRYFFEAVALLNIAMAYCAMSARQPGSRLFSTVTLLLLLVSGASQYMHSRQFFLIYPAWAPQVQAWKVDPNHKFLVAPGTATWVFTLPHDHPNLPLAAGTYDSTRVPVECPA